MRKKRIRKNKALFIIGFLIIALAISVYFINYFFQEEELDVYEQLGVCFANIADEEELGEECSFICEPSCEKVSFSISGLDYMMYVNEEKINEGKERCLDGGSNLVNQPYEDCLSGGVDDCSSALVEGCDMIYGTALAVFKKDVSYCDDLPDSSSCREAMV